MIKIYPLLIALLLVANGVLGQLGVHLADGATKAEIPN